MDPKGLDAIASELCGLLQDQIETVMGREFDDFTEDELVTYRQRKEQILELRAELQKSAKPT